MRNIIWFFFLLTISAWFAISIFWTGNTDTKVTIPESNSLISVPEEPISIATISATPTPTLLATPSAASTLHY